MSFEPDRRTADRRDLASVLRELRKASGLSGDRLAVRTGISQSKISRIETGRTLPTVVDVERILKELKVPDAESAALLELARATNVDYVSGRAVGRLGFDVRQRELTALINSTSLYQQFLPAMPPGFLQIDAYVECVMRPAVATSPNRDVARAVQARREMRSVLDDESRRFELVLTEQALRWNYAGSEVMADQLSHMADMAMKPNVHLFVVPHGARVEKGPLNTFGIYDRRLVLTELFNGAVSFRDPRDVAHHLELFEFFGRQALTGSDAIGLLREVAADYRSMR